MRNNILAYMRQGYDSTSTNVYFLEKRLKAWLDFHEADPKLRTTYLWLPYLRNSSGTKLRIYRKSRVRPNQGKSDAPGEIMIFEKGKKKPKRIKTRVEYVFLNDDDVVVAWRSETDDPWAVNFSSGEKIRHDGFTIDPGGKYFQNGHRIYAVESPAKPLVLTNERIDHGVGVLKHRPDSMMFANEKKIWLFGPSFRSGGELICEVFQIGERMKKIREVAIKCPGKFGISFFILDFECKSEQVLVGHYRGEFTAEPIYAYDMNTKEFREVEGHKWEDRDGLLFLDRGFFGSG